MAESEFAATSFTSDAARDRSTLGVEAVATTVAAKRFGVPTSPSVVCRIPPTRISATQIQLSTRARILRPKFAADTTGNQLPDAESSENRI
jgi:hypothetical protein